MVGLSELAKVSTALSYASANADRTGAIIDMANYDGVLMIVTFGAIDGGAVTSIKAQSGATSNMSDAADLAGTAITVADNDDNQIFVLDINRPRERYVRLYVDKDAANATAESAIYVQYGPRVAPVVNTVTDLVTCELHLSPAEGTA